MTVLLLFLSFTWLIATGWGAYVWVRNLIHSQRAQRAHREAGQNGVYEVIARTSIRVDWVGIALCGLMVALVVNGIVVPADVRPVVGRILGTVLGVCVAVMGNEKYAGETLARFLLRRASVEEHAREGTKD